MRVGLELLELSRSLDARTLPSVRLLNLELFQRKLELSLSSLLRPPPLLGVHIQNLEGLTLAGYSSVKLRERLLLVGRL